MNKKLYAPMFALLLALGGTNVLAQTANEDFRKTAPVPLAPAAFAIAKPSETTLPNGLKVVVIEDKRLPLVSYRLAFRSGSVNDPQNARGLTSAVTALLNEGTTTRNSSQIADETEKIGASISASSTADNTIIAASALSGYAPDVLKLMADVALNPSFPESEISLYKQNTIKNLQFQRSQPSFLADEQISRIVFGKNPYGNPAPVAADIEKISREQLVNFYKSAFIPNNATLIVVGDVNKEALMKQVSALFGAWQKADYAAPKFDAAPVRTERTLTIVDRPGSTQSNIVLANAAIDRSSPDYFPVLVMNQILGGGASARLFMNLREAKGYTYGAYSNVSARRQAGIFQSTAEVRTPVTGDSLKEFYYELDRIRKEPVGEQEIKDAKNYLTGVFPLVAETQEGVTNLIVTQELFNLPDDYLQTYRDKINMVTAADIQRVAQKYVVSDKNAIVIVGDAGEILKQVKPYATRIEIYDAQGKAVDANSYNQPSAAPTVDVTGKWSLNLTVQGQVIPVTLDLKQDGDKVTGSLDSMLGKGDIPAGKISGNKLTAAAKTMVQGQPVELNLTGTVEGETMKGVINTGMPGFPPVSFEGTRAKAAPQP